MFQYLIAWILILRGVAWLNRDRTHERIEQEEKDLLRKMYDEEREL